MKQLWKTVPWKNRASTGNADAMLIRARASAAKIGQHRIPSEGCGTLPTVSGRVTTGDPRLLCQVADGAYRIVISRASHKSHNVPVPYFTVY